MNLGQKCDRAADHVRSILRHDDEGIAFLRAAARVLHDMIDAELRAAEVRHTNREEKTQ